MNYYLIKEYLKKLLADELAFFYFKVMFWFLFSIACIVIAIGSFALVGILLIYLPWGELPVSDEGRTLIQVLTFSVICLFILSIEIQVIQKVAGIINKKLKESDAGSIVQLVKSCLLNVIAHSLAVVLLGMLRLTVIFFKYVLPAFLTLAIMFTAFVFSIVFLKITSLVMLTILALIFITISYPVFIVLKLMTLSMHCELLGGRYEK
ncbi:hypothetical protein EJ576_21835 [Pseudomonas sp. C 49-2]|uniref:hypothetical protein n=1 Tax=Pseudomonas sp. C 49-2 TaxID=2496849 RepID=UPI000F81DA9D|nr:hypothetical protein [Pseudomonas sp. C 49-2]RTX96369.1 hypothetical protein EJ576_21835 [Pseudomonas sp. C 49-2]